MRTIRVPYRSDFTLYPWDMATCTPDVHFISKQLQFCLRFTNSTLSAAKDACHIKSPLLRRYIRSRSQSGWENAALCCHAPQRNLDGVNCDAFTHYGKTSKTRSIPYLTKIPICYKQNERNCSSRLSYTRRRTRKCSILWY